MYNLVYTKRFKKQFKNLETNEQKLFARKMDLFIENELHPSLRTRKLQGNKSLYESSINKDIRIIWYYEDDLHIVLIEIGHHDILNKY
ncbi:type II toxin-antitoxin system mRNA interferase toxin, RelE/StbE family [Mycoplasmatota bacterium]|nr:type II toxin-antitoxin system mRNA interferase toxin, RelE/StbE family [Mycoplasmatota bacterium]